MVISCKCNFTALSPITVFPRDTASLIDREGPVGEESAAPPPGVCRGEQGLWKSTEGLIS